MLAPKVAALPVVPNREGTLYVRGTRIPLHSIISSYEQGSSPEEIVQDYPSLKIGDVYILLGYYLLQSPVVREEMQREDSVASGDVERPYSLPPSKRVQQIRAEIREHEFRTLIDIWAQYVNARRKLRAASFTRSNKSAEAEFAEWLVQHVFDGEPLPGKSNRGYDVIADDMRIQVKSLSKDEENQNGYKITEEDRSNDPSKGATHYAFVFFRNFVPDAMFLVPASVVVGSGKTQIKRADLEKIPGAKVDIDLRPFADAINHQ
jgi:uncharacterized protein (DUF433 family)